MSDRLKSASFVSREGFYFSLSPITNVVDLEYRKTERANSYKGSIWNITFMVLASYEIALLL